jgi:hypothetical protein
MTYFIYFSYTPFIDNVLSFNERLEYHICLYFTLFGHIYKKKNTSNFGHCYKQKLTTFKLINTTIPIILLFNSTLFLKHLLFHFYCMLFPRRILFLCTPPFNFLLVPRLFCVYSYFLFLLINAIRIRIINKQEP